MQLWVTREQLLSEEQPDRPTKHLTPQQTSQWRWQDKRVPATSSSFFLLPVWLWEGGIPASQKVTKVLLEGREDRALVPGGPSPFLSPRACAAGRVRVLRAPAADLKQGGARAAWPSGSNVFPGPWLQDTL